MRRKKIRPRVNESEHEYLKQYRRNKGDEVILILSDLHAPYNHPQAVEFLEAIKYKAKQLKKENKQEINLYFQILLYCL